MAQHGNSPRPEAGRGRFDSDEDDRRGGDRRESRDEPVSPRGFGGSAAGFGGSQARGPAGQQGGEGYGHYGRSAGGGRDDEPRGRDYGASQGRDAIPGDFGNGTLVNGYGREDGGSGNDRQQHWDPDYHQWRSEQMRNLDNDYADWRRERYRKFSDEFNTWRRARAATSGPDDSSASATSGASASAASPTGSGTDASASTAKSK